MLAVPHRLKTRVHRWRHARTAAISTLVAGLGIAVMASCAPIPATTAFVFPLAKSQAGPPGTWGPDQGVDIEAPCGANLASPENGIIIAEGIGGFGPYAPELLVTQGPLTG